MVKGKKDEEIKDVEVTIPVELDDYVKERIDKEVSLAVSKAEKKLLKTKNIAIFKRDIIIIILIFFYVLLGYNLYNTNYFNKFISKYIRNNSSLIENKESSSDSSGENDESKLQESINKEKLISKYTALTEKIKFFDKSDNIKSFINGELTDEVKEEIVFNALDKSSFDVASKITSVDGDVVKKLGNSYFTSFSLKNFSYNNSKVHYLEDTNLFIFAESNIKDNIQVSSKVLDVKENLKDNQVQVSVLLYIINNNKLYNPESLKEVSGYKDNDNITKYNKELPNLVYVFSVADEGIYKLDKILKNMEE